jgi:hypothetical protein
VITEIIDSSGDGAGNNLQYAYGIAVDGSGKVYVMGNSSHNVFKIQIQIGIFADGFESSDTLAWSDTVP